MQANTYFWSRSLDVKLAKSYRKETSKMYKIRHS